MKADIRTYLACEVRLLNKIWPDNTAFNIVFHGHSQPSGYTAAHMVKTFDAYPHRLHQILAARFPTAVINSIITAVGGENSISGAKRFEQDTLCHKPNIIVIDYGGNDLFEPEEAVKAAWRHMIECALKARKKVILLTPQPDCGHGYGGADTPQQKRCISREDMCALLAELADKYGVALADTYSAFTRELNLGRSIHEYLISVNHLNAAGHSVVAAKLAEWFPYIHPDYSGS